MNSEQIELPKATEDKIKDLYNKYIGSDDRKYRGIAIGIKETLNILNITIKEVTTVK